MSGSARRRFGQHFLIDSAVLHRLVATIQPERADKFLEIGPGRGALTQLLAEQLTRFTAIEIDRDLIPALTQRFNNLKLFEGDVLKLDLAEIFASAGHSKEQRSKWRIVGNLPYNISTPLLDRLFQHLDSIRDMHFMLQKEVVNRLVAVPGTKAWGKMSVMMQYYCQLESLFDVPPTAFQPPPRVDSSVIRILPVPPLEEVSDPVIMRKLVTEAFNQRRKTLRNSLKAWLLDWQALSVDETQRPDHLSVADYVTLTNEIIQQNQLNLFRVNHTGKQEN